ncbi:hypothetical protein [Coxiella burnetii]|nr:hypothetical protein [Coxiella burnetii]
MIKKIEAKQYPALSLIDIQGGSIACIRTLLGALAIWLRECASRDFTGLL